MALLNDSSQDMGLSVALAMLTQSPVKSYETVFWLESIHFSSSSNHREGRRRLKSKYSSRRPNAEDQRMGEKFIHRMGRNNRYIHTKEMLR